MKFFTYLIATTLLFGIMSACNNNGSMSSSTPDLNSQIDSVSFAIGYQQGNFLKNEGLDELSMNDFQAGFSTGINGEEPVMTEEKMFALINTFRQQLSEAAREENMKEGEEFLEANKEKDGVMVTDSGLQYKVLEEGDGNSPSETDVVRVNYEGRLVDGEVFESSFDSNPVEFPLNRVIPGWTEGVQLMSEGSTYEFYIPYNLAYGANPPQGSQIGPNSTLIFKVELIDINP